PSVDLEAEPTPAFLEWLYVPATRVDNGLIGGGLAPAQALLQFTTEILEGLGKERVHFKTRQTERRGYWADRRRGGRGAKDRGSGNNSTATQKRLAQTQTFEHRLPTPTDELATNSMAWAVSGLQDCDWRLVLAKANAQRQGGQTTADDCDGV